MRLHELPERPPLSRCICRGPLYISIPAGGHIHIQCPEHGDVVIHGAVDRIYL
jgi:hypothetical protein